MTSNHDPAGATGVLRIAAGRLAGLPYRYRWVDHDHGGDLVYAQTAADLLDHWLPGYR